MHFLWKDWKPKTQEIKHGVQAEDHYAWDGAAQATGIKQPVPGEQGTLGSTESEARGMGRCPGGLAELRKSLCGRKE